MVRAKVAIFHGLIWMVTREKSLILFAGEALFRSS